MRNVSLNFLSAILSLGAVPAAYKPIPVGRTKHRKFNSPGDPTGISNLLLVGPHNITYLPKFADLSDPACHVEPYNAPPIGYQDFPPYDENIATIFRYRQQRSVNLGSWFAHESWMTPSVFDCAAGEGVAEIDIANGWGSKENARAVLERHWDTFVTENDFLYLSTVGVNTVRLPIGYWSLGPDFCKDTPFADVAEVYQHSWNRIVRAINLAGQYGLGVLVDLHGAVGSQNGQHHSGISDGQMNLFSDAGNQDKTISVLTYLTKMLLHVNNVVGIEILNEPQYADELEGFYSRALDEMRGVDADAAKFPLYLHNGFDMDRFSQYLSQRSDFSVQDHHSYFVYTDVDRGLSAVEHVKNVGDVVSSAIHQASDKVRGNMIIGEFCCALTPDSMSRSSETDGRAARIDFCRGQVDTYSERTAGWHFWGYLKEDCDQDLGWCFKSAITTVLSANFASQHAKPIQTWVNSTRTNANWGDVGEAHLHSLGDMVDLPLHRRDDNGSQPTDAGTHGYNDGKLTAQVFASHNDSRLGFVDQYISDSIQNLISIGTLSAGSEGQYNIWRRTRYLEDKDLTFSWHQFRAAIEAQIRNKIDGKRHVALLVTAMSLSSWILSGYRLALSLLTNPKHFWKLAALVLVGDAVLTQLIITFIPYTEIDWETYMVQTNLYLKGENDYSKISGPTGPLVYPAGHVRIHQILYTLTDGGKNVGLAQHIYGSLYLTTLVLTCAIYRKARTVPNWLILVLPLSKRLHSIYALRMFNDCWVVFFSQLAILACQYGFGDSAWLLFSAAVSVKMSALLYLPGLLVISFKRRGPASTILSVVKLVATQVIFASSFLRKNPRAYAQGAFDLGRVFLYKWTVNWRLLDEETFLDKRWAMALLIGHVTILAAFGWFRWCKIDGGAWPVLSRGWKRPLFPAALGPITPDYIATVLFTSNLIGILFARSLHYQFYSWYAHQLPFLAWKTKYPSAVRLAIIAGIEYAWNVFPSTVLSSSVLLLCNVLLLLGVWFGDASGKDVTTGRPHAERQ